MTMKLPVAGFAAATRSMERVAELARKLDWAGLIFQIPSSLAAKPACGNAAAKMSAVRVERTVRRGGVAEKEKENCSSMGWGGSLGTAFGSFSFLLFKDGML